MHKFFNKIKKTVSISLAAAILLQLNAAASASDEYLSRVKEVSAHTYTLAEGAVLTKSVLSDSKYGYQRTYKIEYTPGKFSEIVFEGGESLYSRKSMASLMESAGGENGTAVGAINADFFNMSTGVPVSAFINDGILYTTDLDNMCFAIDNNGNAFFDKPKIQISMTRAGSDYQVIIMNKEFVNYSMCLYTDVYSSSTKITDASTELVLYPYSEVYTADELIVREYGEIPTAAEASETEGKAAEPSEQDEQIYYDEAEIESSEEETKESEPIAEQANADNADEESSLSENLKIADEIADENGYTKIADKYYLLEKAAPRLGQSQNAVVAQVRKNSADSAEHSIPSGAYVLASDNRAYGGLLAGFAVGETVSFNFSGNEKFYDVKQAIGCGCIIVKDGKAVVNTDVAHYKTANPRSAVGITADGKVILFAVDGRQSGISAGLTLADLSQEMLKAGCIYAANLDGGGSTAVKALLPFSMEPITVNKPSDSSERKVANAIVVTNTLEPDGTAEYSYFTRGAEYVLKDAGAPLGYTYYTDKNHYPVDPTNVNTTVFSYDADGKGSVRDGYYYPEGYVGKAIIYSRNKDGSYNEATSIVSTDKLDSIYILASEKEIYVGETIDFDAGAKRYSFDVYCDDENFTWSVSPEYGYIFENGLFFATGAGDEVVVTASYGNTKCDFTVKVKEPPFADISGHWSASEVCKLYEKGVVVGEITDKGRMFFPERTYTRNEFCTMLSRIMGLTDANNVSSERPNMEFSDAVLIPDWAYESVYSLYDRGLLKSFAHSGMMFDGSLPVTRREVVSVIGRICPAAPEDFDAEFSDSDESDSDYKYIKNAVYAGIFEGYEDGSLRLDRSLTRAEGAAVFTRLSDCLKK